MSSGRWGPTGEEVGRPSFAMLAAKAIAEMAGTVPDDILLALVDEATRLREFDLALRALGYVSDRGMPAALTQRALIALERGERSDAIDIAQRAIGAGDPDAYIVLGNAFVESGESVAAGRAYEEARKANVLESYANLGQLSEATVSIADAERWYRDGAERGDPLAKQNLGILLAEQSRYEEAVGILLDACRDSDTAWFDLGNCYVSTEEFRSASEAYRRGAVFGDVRCHLALADVLADNLADAEEAERHYKVAVRYGDPLAYWNYAVFLLDEGRREEAYRFLAIAGVLGQKEAWVELATFYEERGDATLANALARLGRD